MTTIYCDEAGNSGENLLDPVQPFFVLASNDFSPGEAEDILEPARSAQTNEIKFGNLKGSKSGVARLIRVLSDPRLHPNRVAGHFIDKRYMVATKLVDLAVETVLNERGMDLYVDGANIAMSNMLFHGLPLYCGKAVADAFLDAFVRLIRRQNTQTRDGFFAAARDAVQASKHAKFQQLIEPFADESTGEIWLPHINPHALDPAIPALFQHIVVWGRRKRAGFRVVHDDSKPILATEQFFRAMLAGDNEASSPVGYDRRQFDFPLRATELSQANSSEHPQLQLADLCAGSINHFLRAKAADNLDELARAFQALDRGAWVIGAVTPSMDVTPEGLQTEGGRGANPIDPVVDRLFRRH
jgi:Protein of unknown function (DUF3800)